MPIPETYVCPKCGHTGKYSDAMVAVTEKALMTGSSTFDAFDCPRCRHSMSLARIRAGDYKKKGW